MRVSNAPLFVEKRQKDTNSPTLPPSQAASKATWQGAPP